MSTLTRKGPGRPPMNEHLARTRQDEILDAAAKIFARRGFPGTDLQELADELGVAKGTIYRYFPSKRELFLAAADRGMQRLKAEIDAGVSAVSDPFDKIERGIRHYFRFFDQHPEYIELIVQERAEFRDRGKSTYFQHCEVNVLPWQDLFAGLMRQGRVRRMPVQWITDVVSNLIYGTMFTRYFTGGERSLESYTPTILDIILSGILSVREKES